MSNIHSLADYRRDGAAPSRGGAPAMGSPTPLIGGRPNFGTIGGLRTNDASTLGGAPSAGGFNEVGYSYEVRLSLAARANSTRQQHTMHTTLTTHPYVCLSYHSPLARAFPSSAPPTCCRARLPR